MDADTAETSEPFMELQTMLQMSYFVKSKENTARLSKNIYISNNWLIFDNYMARYTCVLASVKQI